ncbi:hypothetical protein ED733_003384 [Metarhizium rileyi]|uniref:Uncharacterized protein n=1 Tax=Metarhizium rileyi (strain RCEF 4871) TaxID=1649241 RepID=A0A5C6G4L0_METRR|nr:hypothetical protein ED733_003384 [Metarhizium rileyi]
MLQERDVHPGYSFTSTLKGRIKRPLAPHCPTTAIQRYNNNADEKFPGGTRSLLASNRRLDFDPVALIKSHIKHISMCLIDCRTLVCPTCLKITWQSRYFIALPGLPLRCSGMNIYYHPTYRAECGCFFQADGIYDEMYWVHVAVITPSLYTYQQFVPFQNPGSGHDGTMSRPRGRHNGGKHKPRWSRSEKR